MFTETLGIYPESINKAYEVMSNTVNSIGLSKLLDGFDKKVKKSIKRLIVEEEPDDNSTLNDLTNSIIYEMFDIMQDAINDVIPDLMVYANANGFDSSFEVGGVTNEETTRIRMLIESELDRSLVKKALKVGLVSLGVSDDDFKCILKERNIVKDLVKAMKNYEFNYTIYKNAEELGADNSDNGCRYEDDTDETFGLFLIQAYHDGHSDAIYAELTGDQILEAWPFNMEDDDDDDEE